MGVSTSVKPCDIEVVANGFDDCVADADDGVLALAAQPEVAVIHQEVDAVFFGGDGVGVGFGDALEDLDAFDIHFDSRRRRGRRRGSCR